MIYAAAGIIIILTLLIGGYLLSTRMDITAALLSMALFIGLMILLLLLFCFFFR